METALPISAPESPAAEPRAAMRRMMFTSQDGVMLCVTLRALDALGMVDPSLQDGRSLAELYPELTEPGFGSIRAAVRCLAGQGWISAEPTMEPTTTVLSWTEQGRLALRHKDSYVALGEFLSRFSDVAPDAWSRPWDRGRTDAFLDLVEPACARWGLPADLPPRQLERIATQLDSGLVVPTMVWLRSADRLTEEGPAPPPDRAGEGMGRLLAAIGWTDGDGRWSTRGRWAAEFAELFGMVASYLPLLARLPEIYLGELKLSDRLPAGSPEWHVHRELNLSVSSIAHRRYFAEADAIFLDLFDREPVDRQPRFIADTGCGDGSWLARLYALVRERTKRGERLSSDPLLMVGIDSSATALERARIKLDDLGVPSLLIAGDVTDPDGIATDLAGHGLAMEDGLHIRAFLDHDRAYLGTSAEMPVPGWSSGAYIDDRGRPLSGEAVERDLVSHLQRWARHVRRHGLILLEAHCVAPRIAVRHLGALHSGAFDAYHAYSHQYPVDHQAFMRCCHAAGLEQVTHSERQYPSSKPFVSVSLNRFLASGPEARLPAIDLGTTRADTWEPDPGADLEDGVALHRLLFADGDIRFPRTWCAAATGFVVGGTLEAIEARLEARAGEAIRVMDYGAGTGTATIELLKACAERGLDRRLEEHGARLELHLVDLPSSWFAQGYALLRACNWTRFHSLRGADGGFSALSEVLEGRAMDVVMANMVLHLIPARALERAADELASVIAPGGRLLWSAPDLGPPGPYSLLLHDANRALRERWLELLHGAREPSSRLEDIVREVRAGLDTEAMRAAQRRADRRILPRPLTSSVSAALARWFEGEIEVRSYEMLSEELLDALLVPSNQAEFLPELADKRAREWVIRELMLREVLPALQQGPAGTDLGLNLHWTLGAFTRRARVIG